MHGTDTRHRGGPAQDPAFSPDPNRSMLQGPMRTLHHSKHGAPRPVRVAGAVLLGMGLALGLGAGVSGGPAVAAATSHGIAVAAAPTPAFNGDAPDPDVVHSGSTYYAFTTGTPLGNHIQVLVDTTGNPATGWRSTTGTGYGSSALPVTPSWQQANTQTSPGVFAWDGGWRLYYDAALSGHASDTGDDCLSVATAGALSPTDATFTDDSSGPLLCQPSLGGAIDPSPFVDPTTGQAFLVWKSNDGGSDQPAQLWSQQLSADGMSLVGTPHLLLTQDTTGRPWETTVEDPDLVDSGGAYFLVFSVGQYDTSSYAEADAVCAGPTGPCSQSQSGLILTSSGSASGPGGGSLFPTPSGQWYLVYAAWAPGCTSYSCGGSRRMFVAPATLTSPGLAGPVTGMAATPDGNGYWLVDAQGAVSSHGSAQGFGSMAGVTLDAPMDHIVATPDGKGYWLVAADGGIFTFGDARFFGSMGGRRLDAPVVDLAPTADGRGYWLVASDGGIFAFGDAAFHGSMGGRHLNRPVVGISADGATGGYWLVASDGGIFAFDAPFRGSTGGLRLDQPVNGMAATTDDRGYWFVAADGGIFAFGDARFHGSMGGIRLDQPVVGMAADPSTGGYWLVASDGGIFSFDAPFEGAD